MAKSSSGRGRRSRRPMDWVVNRDTYGAVVSLPNATQLASALTLPQGWSSTIDSSLTTPSPGYNFPEQDQGQLAYAVKGHIGIIPGTWAAGSQFRAWFRLVVKPIEFDTVGVPIVIEDPNYSLVATNFANERFLSQWMRWETFAQGTAGEVLPINWRGAARIRQDEALWLYIENQSGITQTLTFHLFLRTLMRANQ